MGGLLTALNAAKTSISTNQKSMEIIGNNIANVNTPGYSRQTPILSPYPTLAFGEFFIGQGVRVGSIERAYDTFLTKQISHKNTDLGLESGKANPLAATERALPIDERSIAAEIDRFFDTWQELSTNPDGQVERELVMQQASLLGDIFYSTYNDLQDVVNNIDDSLLSKVDDLNNKLTQVADLNSRITSIEMAGQNANADRDRRDLLVKELAFTLGVRSIEDKNSMVSLQLPGGMPLVDGAEALTVSAVHNGSIVDLELAIGQTTIQLPRSGLGGEFRGLLDVRDDLIPNLQGQLDQLAFDLANTINAQHALGVGLDGVGGRNLFTSPTQVSGAATNLQMILTNNDQVAAGASSSPGDNSNALAVASLRDNTFVNGSDSYTNWYGKITATIGMEANQNTVARAGLEDTIVQLTNVLDGTVGVSLEEEMINLLQYQKGFEASAKFLSTVDEMMDAILMIKR